MPDLHLYFPRCSSDFRTMITGIPAKPVLMIPRPQLSNHRCHVAGGIGTCSKHGMLAARLPDIQMSVRSRCTISETFASRLPASLLNIISWYLDLEPAILAARLQAASAFATITVQYTRKSIFRHSNLAPLLLHYSSDISTPMASILALSFT
jgi:hypothetical protein